MLRSFAVAALCGFPLFPLAAQPSIVRLSAVADASADADQPTVNFGSDPLVTCGKTFTNTPTFRVWLTRGHFRFDISSLAGLGTPRFARLRLYQAQANAAGCLDTTAHRITAAWNESTLNWYNQPTHDPTVLDTTCVGDSFSLGWKSYDVTAAVTGWLGSAPNYGIVVRDRSESLAGASRPLHAASREGTDPTRAPTLEVYFGTAPFGTGCGASTIPELELDRGTPARGDTYELRASGFPSGAPLMLLFGLSDTTWNGLPLPYNLAGIGYPACNVLVSDELLLLNTADRLGTGRFSFTMPNRPGVVGLRLFHQVLGLDNSQQIGLTNGFVAQLF